MSNRAERGIALVVSLIALVAMTLAGIALMRSVTGGVVVTGNLQLKKNATVSADLGVELGRAWLAAQASLDANNLSQGYYSNWGNPVWDPLAHDWSATSRDGGTDAVGNRVRYVVHRMCRDPGKAFTDPTQSCVLAIGAGSGSSKRDAGYADPRFARGTSPYYRVTARVDGPKSTVSYIQAMLVAE